MKKQELIMALIFIVGVILGIILGNNLSSSTKEGEKQAGLRELEIALEEKEAEAFHANRDLEKVKKDLQKASDDLDFIEDFLRPKVSLKGSLEAVNFEKYMVRKEKLAILKDRSEADRMKKSWALEKFNAGKYVKIDPFEIREENAYCLRRVILFLRDLGDAFHAKFKKNIWLTSMLRDSKYNKKERRRNNNVTENSPHQTGAAIDLKKGEIYGKYTRRYGSKEMKWLREYFLKYERAGLIQATEEHLQPNFHIMVFGNYKKLD
ncbi:hypothetical protein A3A09_01275 [Candidatus Nomurabacteria bacterium RIFCSPLOWO2_01_FULL_42_20]|uniref:Uncharacterized protein n=1 Tax=Candidatus Nomurabacteria bacterium RIFCSPHIGHO2_01_FULL_42_16 TaxID=1801743 RepID=A0A1F6VI25_9BACT|nr:MAG: hypothetical protein A2824_01650 [Candidatus Nomurabacteria bacterium RIFCSPHIGHO2_01_FULL_42_16]OGI92370.1 MAG: hypothetical protein A3A09_01275 [Candidatus Nomurabacteria bacterium RIFCSPLOWO2_01_FULL_42_20]